MDIIHGNLPNLEDFIDGPTDDELKRIEEEMDKYSN